MSTHVGWAQTKDGPDCLVLMLDGVASGGVWRGARKNHDTGKKEHGWRVARRNPYERFAWCADQRDAMETCEMGPAF